MNTNHLKLAAVLATLVGLCACAAYPETEADYGNSVRHMVRSQTVTAPANSEPVDTGDGDRVNSVLEAYRTDVTRSDGGPTPVSIQFGGGTPQSQ